jgi:hypothetical protein
VSAARGLRPAILALAAGLALGATATASGANAAHSGSTITLYSVATSEQFINNADDRARGKGNNPFGNYKDVAAAVKESGNGPFAGDEAIYTFNVYSNANLKQQAGTGTYTCFYDLDKNAFCDVSYALKGSTLLGSGEFNFKATKFVLAVLGGTGRYSSAAGQLLVVPSKDHAQRLTLELS